VLDVQLLPEIVRGDKLLIVLESGVFLELAIRDRRFLIKDLLEPLDLIIRTMYKKQAMESRTYIWDIPVTATVETRKWKA